MRKEIFVLILFCISIKSYAQNYITGNVVDEAGKCIEGVNVKWKDHDGRTISDKEGNFRIENLDDTLMFSSIGFDTTNVSKPFSQPLIVVLKTGDNILKPVEISTGYYTAPQERFTGSFVHIDNDLLNRSSGEDILNR